MISRFSVAPTALLMVTNNLLTAGDAAEQLVQILFSLRSGLEAYLNMLPVVDWFIFYLSVYCPS